MKVLIRQIGIWVLLLLYVAAVTPLHEVFKLPAFIEHYQEHRSENPAFTLAGFIVLHYLSGSPYDADYERDMQLPFKTLEVTHMAFAATHFPPEPAYSAALPVPVCRKCLPNPALLAHPSPFVATPSQPPEA